jgi:DNA replication protein DnaC
MPIHKDCTVENYIVTTAGQNNARNFANYYIDSFSENKGECFVFSGTTGTGKNHLSAAICNDLMPKGFTCLIITVSELMTKSRKCYGDKPEFTEDDFIKNMVDFDLLIIDEIGLQKNTDHEKIILNQIIDRRLGYLKPVGILTNLDKTGSEKLLGSRIMSRLKSNNGQWIIFNWKDFR